MGAGLKLPEFAAIAPHTFVLHEDFLETAITNRWSTVVVDSGTSVAIDADGVGGVVTLTTGGTDNNEAYLYSAELFKIANNKTLYGVFRLQYAEANTDDANVAFGFMDAVGANSILDDGAGPKASFDGVCIYKVDGGTRWNVRVSRGASDSTLIKVLDLTAGGASYQTFAISVQPISSTQAEVTLLCDPLGGQNFQPVYEYGVNYRARVPLTLTVTYTSTTEIAAFVGVKAGGANSEVVNVDYTTLAQTR
jgi:hypothetical protein